MLWPSLLSEHGSLNGADTCTLSAELRHAPARSELHLEGSRYRGPQQYRHQDQAFGQQLHRQMPPKPAGRHRATTKLAASWAGPEFALSFIFCESLARSYVPALLVSRKFE